MPRRLIVCADGTWNSPRRAGDGEDTNVEKLYNALRYRMRDGSMRDLSGQQSHYIRGVGTGGPVDKILGGIGGYGISDNICEAYRFRVNTYEEGDEIYLFGFSRGAYTVRSLVGMIRNCGLLHEYHGHRLRDAYKLYRDRSPDAHPKEKRARHFRRSYARKVEITFLGVWDTVGSLGIPDCWIGAQLNPALKINNQFHDVTLSSWVKNAYHAIALDERRMPFMPTLWKTQGIRGQKVEQCWFPGVHSDIGGGYHETDLSDIALDWMMERAERCGLEFWRKQRVLVKPNPAGTMHESLNAFYEPFGAARRSIPPIAPYRFARHGDPKSVIHESVFERMRHDFGPGAAPYYPANLAEYLADPFAAAPVEAHVAAQAEPLVWLPR